VSIVRSQDRWYRLKDHPEQLKLVQAVASGVRFPVVPAGRRSGKTERFKRFLVKQAMLHPNERYFAAAPTRDQAKKIFWNDLKLLSFSDAHDKKPSETELTIHMPNGSEIHVIGLDRPERIEGVTWTGGGIDEFGDTKEDAWGEHIMPALDTIDPRRPDYRAWCWIFGVPEGLNHYYDLFRYAEQNQDPLWKTFHWKSAEILPSDVIEAAKRVLSPRQFRQEYEASFETAEGRIYSDYCAKNHTSREIKPTDKLHWMHDQNFTPLSSAIGVVENNQLFLLDEIVLESAISRESAQEFVQKYENHQNKHVLVYGDPAGRAGEKHGHSSDYTEIEDVLRANGWRFERKVKNSAPAIKDRQNSVRARIYTADGQRHLFVNPEKAPWCDKGLSTVQFKKGSAFQEDQKNQYQHITTAIGYMVESIWAVNKPVFITGIHSAM
jgi:hypothetical protein